MQFLFPKYVWKKCISCLLSYSEKERWLTKWCIYSQVKCLSLHSGHLSLVFTKIFSRKYSMYEKMYFIPSLLLWKEKLVDVAKSCIYSQGRQVMCQMPAFTRQSETNDHPLMSIKCFTREYSMYEKLYYIPFLLLWKGKVVDVTNWCIYSQVAGGGGQVI